MGSGNSPRSTPKSRKMALFPDPNGISSIRSIATTSPGFAPRTSIGPVIGASGCPSQAGVKGVETARMSATSSKAPRTSIVNSSPDSTLIVGGGVDVHREEVFGSVCPHLRSRATTNG